MAKFSCFPTLLLGKKKKVKESNEAAGVNEIKKAGVEKLKPAKFNGSPIHKYNKEANSSLLLTLESNESTPTRAQNVTDNSCLAGIEVAYEGCDEHDETLSMRRDFSDFDLEAQANAHGSSISYQQERNYYISKSTSKKDNCVNETIIQSGHVSDPGVGHTTAFGDSPMLKRSCSNIEGRITRRPTLSPSKSLSYDDLENISGKERGDDSFRIQNQNIPVSPRSCGSADMVILKKQSSSQVLPSRSRKLWWKLFLWSHRNLHNSWVPKPKRLFSTSETSNLKGGYTSDTLEPNLSPNKKLQNAKENQWVAFSMDASPFDRVNAWVKTLDETICADNDDEDGEEPQGEDASFTTSYNVGESSRTNLVQTRCFPEEIIQARNIIQSLNSLSSGAHICGMGLKVIPAISAFTSLRSVNLSNNFVVHVTSGTLPKNLHTLDLSRNKITTIEGLKDLIRLRVLNLSYNKISRIGQGLSNCTLIKELYLSGNKISNVEGLHRLLKLSLLDLSFNKITMVKSLGQLVANYNSLVAVNLLGNPIQSNIGDDQLRKAVSSLLPKLRFLNKQAIKPQRAREVATDSIARAALGDSRRSSRRKMVRRVNQGPGSSSVRGRVGEVSSHKGHSTSRSKHRSDSKHSRQGPDLASRVTPLFLQLDR